MNTASSVISSSKVDGTIVYSPTGEKLGSIASLMIDKLSGKVRYAVMEFGGFLGMGTDQYPLAWNSLKYDKNLGGYMVSLETGQLESAPKYAKNAAPEYTDEYGRHIYDYYRVPWN